ncbi:hypothetical protein PBAL39_16454 [Pedobacter sp. BAL39]|nr:hypothetical protein PBAL39_16454 [Pedobacter sp. BAL39]
MPVFDKDSLNSTDAGLMVKSIYDTVANEPQTDIKEDTVTRDDAKLQYFEDQSGQYYIYVVENRGPMYGPSLGWCDVFIFKRLNGVWKLNDLRFHAGGGGMYGNPGKFEKLEQIGDENRAIVISGGQSHMGNNFNVTLIEVSKGKLGRSFGFPTHHDYGENSGDDYKLTICDENEYHFRKVAGSKHYDLILERFNCLDESSIKVDSAVIAYQNGYRIPDRFSFDE